MAVASKDLLHNRDTQCVWFKLPHKQEVWDMIMRSKTIFKSLNEEISETEDKISTGKIFKSLIKSFYLKGNKD